MPIPRQTSIAASRLPTRASPDREPHGSPVTEASRRTWTLGYQTTIVARSTKTRVSRPLSMLPSATPKKTTTAFAPVLCCHRETDGSDKYETSRTQPSPEPSDAAIPRQTSTAASRLPTRASLGREPHGSRRSAQSARHAFRGLHCMSERPDPPAAE